MKIILEFSSHLEMLDWAKELVTPNLVKLPKKKPTVVPATISVDKSIDVLEFTVKTSNRLKEAGLTTIRALQTISNGNDGDALLEVKGLGVSGRDEVLRVLTDYNQYKFKR